MNNNFFCFYLFILAFKMIEAVAQKAHRFLIVCMTVNSKYDRPVKLFDNFL